MNIAIIDDDSVVLEMTSEIVKKTLGGCNVTQYESADLFVEDVSDFKIFEMIITDVNMPGRSGLDLVRSVRKIYNSDALSIIIISGDNHRAVATDLDTVFVGKPFNVSTFISVLTNCGAR